MSTRRQESNKSARNSPVASNPSVEARRTAAFSRMPTTENDTAKRPNEILNSLSEAMKEEHKPTSATSVVLRDIHLPYTVEEWEESVKDKMKGLSSDDKKQLRELFNFMGKFKCVISKDQLGRNYSIDDFGMRRNIYRVYPFIHITKKCTCALNFREGEHCGPQNTSIASLAKIIQDEWLKDCRTAAADSKDGAEVDECILAMEDFELEETNPKAKKKKRHGT